MKPIVLLGEAYGEHEAAISAGFVGASGIELLRMLDEAKVIELTAEDRSYISKFYNTGDPRMTDAVWQMHPEVYRTNVFLQHPPGNRLEHFCGPKAQAIKGYPSMGKPGYVRAEYAHELERLGDELVDIDPNLIVCLGNSALWALSGKTGVSKLRGTTTTSTHTVSGFKLFAAYHPAAILRQWELRPVTVLDLAKAKREAEFPDVRRPKCEIWIEPGIEDIKQFIHDYIIHPGFVCDILSVDVETSGNRITEVGFAPRPDLAIVIPFDDNRKKDGNYWPTKELESLAWELIYRVLKDRTIRKVFQNGLYDIAFFWRAYGIKVYGATDDTMLLHHALQPESLKSLGFMGSVYTDHGPWKSERKGTTTIKRDE